MKKNISTQILKCLVVVFALYIVFDYFNTASFLGFHVKNINISLFSAIFNAFVVIALYIVTFIVVDKRQIKKDQNAELTAKILMQSSYKKCIDLLKIVSDQEILEKNIVPKIDFNQIGLNEVECRRCLKSDTRPLLRGKQTAGKGNSNRRKKIIQTTT